MDGVMDVGKYSPRLISQPTHTAKALTKTEEPRRTRRTPAAPQDRSERTTRTFDGSKTSHDVAFGERRQGRVRPYEVRLDAHDGPAPTHPNLTVALERVQRLSESDPRVGAEMDRLLRTLDGLELDPLLSSPAFFYAAAVVAQKNLGVTSKEIKQESLSLAREPLLSLLDKGAPKTERTAEPKDVAPKAEPKTMASKETAPLQARPVAESTGPKLSDERVASAIRRLEFMHVDNGIVDLATHYLQVLGRTGARVPEKAEDLALASTALAMACAHAGVPFEAAVKDHGIAAAREYQRATGESLTPDTFARSRLDAYDGKLAEVLAAQVSIADAARAPRDTTIQRTVADATLAAKPTKAADLSLDDSLVFAQFLFAGANYDSAKVPELSNGWFPENALGALHAYAHSVKGATLPGTDLSTASFRAKMGTTMDLSRRYDAIEKLLATTPHSANELLGEHAREIQRQVGQLRADGKDFVVVPFGHNIRLHQQTMPHQLYMTITKTADTAELRVFDRSLVSRIGGGVSGSKFSEFALQMPLAELSGPKGEQALAELMKRGLDGCSVETLLAAPKTEHSVVSTRVSRPQSQQKAQNCTVASFTAVMNSLTDRDGYKDHNADLRRFAVDNLIARDEGKEKDTNPQLTDTLRAIHAEVARLEKRSDLPTGARVQYGFMAAKLAKHFE